MSDEPVIWVVTAIQDAYAACPNVIGLAATLDAAVALSAQHARDSHGVLRVHVVADTDDRLWIWTSDGLPVPNRRASYTIGRTWTGADGRERKGLELIYGAEAWPLPEPWRSANDLVGRVPPPDDWSASICLIAQPPNDLCPHDYGAPVDMSAGQSRYRVWTCRRCGVQQVQDLRDGVEMEDVIRAITRDTDYLALLNQHHPISCDGCDPGDCQCSVGREDGER